MGIKIVTENKKARFDYFIEETMEAGIVLSGSEVKSIRAGQINLKDSFVAFANGEAFLQNAHISEYRASSYNNHIPERRRKLLLHKLEIEKLEHAVAGKGYTVVPTKVYFKDSRVKVEIGLARGRKHADRRDAIKERDVNRELSKTMRKSRS